MGQFSSSTITGASPNKFQKSIPRYKSCDKLGTTYNFSFFFLFKYSTTTSTTPTTSCGDPSAVWTDCCIDFIFNPSCSTLNKLFLPRQLTDAPLSSSPRRWNPFIIIVAWGRESGEEEGDTSAMTASRNWRFLNLIILQKVLELILLKGEGKGEFKGNMFTGRGEVESEGGALVRLEAVQSGGTQGGERSSLRFPVPSGHCT